MRTIPIMMGIITMATIISRAIATGTTIATIGVIEASQGRDSAKGMPGDAG